MKKPMKKPMKKADGGSIAGSAPVSKRTAPMPMPNPSARAREVASPNARFNRPATGGPMSPARPSMPAMPRSMPGAAPRGAGRIGPITTMPISPLKKGGAPMRKAKGGMAKGKK